MSSWIETQRQQILNQKFTSDVLSKSLMTNKIMKRENYACKDQYIMLKNISIWTQQQAKNNNQEEKDYTNSIISLFSTLRCDITTLEIDCIVNAANEGLLGGGGVDEAIHKAAGPLLQFECANLSLCQPGNAVITKGYLLPSCYVIHTVGPYLDEKNKPQPNILNKCYESIMKIVIEYGIKSIAIPPISTGFYGFPKQEAAQIAVNCLLKYVQKNEKKLHHLQRIILVDVSQDGIDCYNKAFQTALN